MSDDTICAISTPQGVGALSIIRLSGKDAITIADTIFTSPRKQKLSTHSANTTHFGTITHNSTCVDNVIASILKAPHSFTGEDSVEFSCHGSPYIVNTIIQLLILNGARMANPGEFTMRAFLNGKIDLIQAEAVADLIASNTKAAHRIAMNQMRGGFSHEIALLRKKLLTLTSLLELELDFGEEDVEFANRDELFSLCQLIEHTTSKLAESFHNGNAIKNGIPVAIVGAPNVGKSTLLNTLLNENRAIVSEIPGTTRDTIEDTIVINGFLFRFIDTAGLRHTHDSIELLGIQRTIENIEKADIIIFVTDITQHIDTAVEQLKQIYLKSYQKLLIAINKIDSAENTMLSQYKQKLSEFTILDNIIPLAAKYSTNIEPLKNVLCAHISQSETNNETIISNIRHYEALTKANGSIKKVIECLKNNQTHEIIASELKDTLHHLGSISGTISNEEVLDSIFKNFCIGK